jgi:TatD DNase family protein
MNLIDTHSHIFSEEFENDRASVIENAFNKGVTKIIVPNIDSKTIDAVLNSCKIKSDSIFPTIGVHPESIKANYKEELAAVKSFIEKEKFVAIGEIGIDLYWDKTFYKEQIAALEEQLQWALYYNLPVILHTREAFDQQYEIVKNFKGIKGVFHAFTGNVEQANKIIDLGFYLGIGGIVTFKNSGLDKTVANVPLERIVLETDAPYLTPTPFRGKRNEPAYVILVAEKLASIFNIPVEEVASVTTKNAVSLFKI